MEAKLAAIIPKPETKCSSRTSYCSVNRLLPNFPQSTQMKLDALKLSITKFNSLLGCKRQIDEETLAALKILLGSIQLLLREDGSIMPELHNVVNALIEAEAGSKCKHLIQKVMQ